MLEKQMLEMRQLPDRVTKLESQIVQLRHEMRDEFSATRAEAQAAVNTVREQLHEQIHAASARTETLMRVLHEETLATTRREVGTVRDALVETNTHMRMLHEEALSRIATVGEGRKTKRKK